MTPACFFAFLFCSESVLYILELNQVHNSLVAREYVVSLALVYPVIKYMRVQVLCVLLNNSTINKRQHSINNEVSDQLAHLLCCSTFRSFVRLSVIYA